MPVAAKTARMSLSVYWSATRLPSPYTQEFIEFVKEIAQARQGPALIE